MAEQSILQKSDCAQLIHNYPLLVKCYQFGKGLEIRGAEVCTCARVSYFFLKYATVASTTSSCTQQMKIDSLNLTELGLTGEKVLKTIF